MKFCKFEQKNTIHLWQHWYQKKSSSHQPSHTKSRTSRLEWSNVTSLIIIIIIIISIIIHPSTKTFNRWVPGCFRNLRLPYLPETNSSPLKNDSWSGWILWVSAYFQGRILVSYSHNPCIRYLPTVAFCGKPVGKMIGEWCPANPRNKIAPHSCGYVFVYMSINPTNNLSFCLVVLSMQEILHQLIGSLFHSLRVFLYPKWLAGFLNHQQ